MLGIFRDARDSRHILLIISLILPVWISNSIFAQTDNTRAEYRVIDVGPDDYLNIRRYPDHNSQIIEKIPNSAKGIKGSGASRQVGTQTWLEVHYNGKTGWVNARYLEISERREPVSSPEVPTVAVDRGIDCLRDIREVRLGDNIARTRSYLCRVGASANTQLRVDFHRLSDVGAGAILKGPMVPEIQALIGRHRIVANRVRATVLELYNKFATKHSEFGCMGFGIEHPGERAAHQGDWKCPSAIWTFQPFVFGAGDASHFPLPDDVAYIQNNVDWPRGYRFFYSCQDEIEPILPYSCTELWRYLTPKDLEKYDVNLRKYNRAVGSDRTPLPAERKYINLLRHVGADSWPQYFLPVIWFPPGCGEAQFNYFPRPVGLDVAVIENSGGAPLELSSLLGFEDESKGLRIEKEEEGSGASRRISETLGTVAPGERVLVPLRIRFDVPEGLRRNFDEFERAKRSYQRIHSPVPGTMYRYDGEEGVRTRKSRESFGAPSQPVLADYVYGPTLRLKGLVINGQRMMLDGNYANHVRFTVGSAEGSCPYLFAWNADQRRWRNYGKVIHQAKGRKNQITHEVLLSKFTTRFLLREEELEVAHIDRVALSVRLKSGRSLMLRAERRALQFEDGKYQKIYAGEGLLVVFRRPHWMKSHHVQSASLLVTGFYEGYGDIRLGRR